MDVSFPRRGAFLWLLVLPNILFLMDSVSSGFTTRCIRNACNQHNSAISCNQSLILILDVTNLKMVRERSAFEKMKGACMAKSSCDPFRICSPSDPSWLLVHYSCINVSQIQRSTCDGRPSKIRDTHGYIQSPDYPSNTARYIPCRWRFDLSNDSFVTLSVHDVATSGTKESCDGGLIVSGSDCDGRGKFAPILLCGGDDLTTLVRCGKVDVELSHSKGLYPLRFWLSYYVQSKPQSASIKIKAPIPSCSSWLYTMGDSQIPGGGSVGPATEDTTTGAPPSDDQSDKQIFIILLFIFCGITIILLIILIIVCIRCRQIRMSVSDPVFSEPSPGLQAHYDYISSLDEEKPRPKLVEEYFEVADALPEDQRRHLPTSPAYAEVEQFAQFKKGKWSSLGSSDWSEVQAGAKDEAEKAVYLRETAGTSKAGIVNKIVPDRFTKNSKQKALKDIQGQKDPGPKVYVVNFKGRPQQSKLLDSKSFDDDENLYDDSATYEQIEVFASKSNSTEKSEKDNARQRLIAGSQESNETNMRYNDKSNYKAKREELNGTFNTVTVRETPTTPSRVNQIKEGLFSKSSTLNNGLERDNEKQNNSRAQALQEKKNFPHNKQLEVLAARNRSQAAKESLSSKKAEADKQNIARTNLLKDGTKTQGIVKNGIRKFEHNTAL